MEIKNYRTLIDGTPSGRVLWSDTPLSFWGGVDVSSGRILDVHHPLYGETVSGKILCIPFDRGSCSGSGVMLEMLRQRTNPIGILCIEAEPVLALGSVIGRKLYGRWIAIRTVPADDYYRLSESGSISFLEDGIRAE